MGSNTNKSSLEQAIGNVFIPRILNPTIRGSIRRSDPDGTHPSPFFLGLTGKSLTLTVTPVGSITVTFASDLMADAISLINSTSPSNLKAIDTDGYLTLVNLNSGNKNLLTIVSGTATIILGFVIAPESGSSSYAGEIGSSSPGRGITAVQNNPQGTKLIAGDEDLSSSVVNRGILGSVEHAERLIINLDREVPIVKRIVVTTITLPTNERAFVITDPTLRFPIDGFNIVTPNPSVLLLGQIVKLKSSTDFDLVDLTQTDPITHISKVIYNTGSINASDNTQTFATWGTPDGKSVFGSQLLNKQPPVSITHVRGSVIEALTATFTTNTVQPGDTVIIESASNNSPFNHNGEFIVSDVIDNTRLVIRAKSPSEKTFVSTNIPTELNSNLPGGTTYGTIRVIVGSYVPATALCFVLPSWVPNNTVFHAYVYGGTRIRDLKPGDLGLSLSANYDQAINTILSNHIIGALSGFRHHAADVDALAVTSSPHSLIAGTVASQITALLALINSPIAAEISYAGGPTWRDGTTNPATTVENQLDKIINDLTGGGGAMKIGYAGGVNWADGTTNPATAVETQIDKILSDLSGATGTAKIQGSAVGTDLLANTLAAQLANLSTNWLKMSRANTISGLQTFTALLTAQAGIVANALIQANLGLTAAIDQHIIVSGVGDYKHGLRTISVPISVGTVVAGPFETGPYSFGITAGNAYVTTISLSAGSRIQAARLVMQEGSTGATFSFRIGFANTNGTTHQNTSVSSTAVSAGTGAVQTLAITLNSPGLVVFSGQTFTAIVSRVTGTSTCILYGIEVDYDRP